MATGDEKFPCDICGRSFKTNRRVGEHQRIHTGEKPFSCDLCEKSFNRQDRLKIHKRYHTGERPYQCPHCEKNFTENSTLFRHFATHDKTEERPFTCDQCPRSFRRKFQLLAHISAHQCQKKNKCEQCDKCFASLSLLKEHARVHSGEKPFSCSVCSKKFRNVSHVKRHMLTHTKFKPFQCAECDKSFELQVRLDSHVYRTGHTGEKQFACPHCKRTYKKKSNYSSHLKSHKLSTCVQYDVSNTEHEIEEFAIEDVHTVENNLELHSEPQIMSEENAAVSSVHIPVLQNDQIIQVLICTNERKVGEDETGLKNKVPVCNSLISDMKQNGPPVDTSAGNFGKDLSTVVILLQDGLEETDLGESNDDILEEVLEESGQLEESN